MKSQTVLYLSLPLVGVLGGFLFAFIADGPRRERYERYSRVQVGMTGDEVKELLGPPTSFGRIMGRSDSCHWAYFVGQDYEFNVEIADEDNRVRCTTYLSQDTIFGQLGSLWLKTRMLVSWPDFEGPSLELVGEDDLVQPD